MGITYPNSMEEVVYFTNRKLESNGNAKAWAFRMDCPKCKKAKMGKPVEDGKIKIRAKEYVCPACNYTEEKAVHEEKLTLCVAYTCPYCSNKSEAETSFKRKNFEGVPSFVFECGKCKKKIGITKKMKATKKKGAASEDDLDDDD